MANPVEEYRRNQRKKELKKNKLNRQKQRNDTLIKTKTLSEIQQEIRKLEGRKSNSLGENNLDSVATRQLERLKKDYKVLLEHHQSKPVQQQAKQIKKTSSELEYPQMSIYYDERLNPFGAAPPGQRLLYHCFNGGTTQDYELALNFGREMGWVPPLPTPEKVEEIEEDEQNIEEPPATYPQSSPAAKNPSPPPQKASIPESKANEQVHESSDPPPPSEAVLRLARQLKGKNINKKMLAVDIWGSTAEEAVCYGDNDEEEMEQRKEQQEYLQKQQNAAKRFSAKKDRKNDERIDNILDPTAAGYTEYRSISESDKPQPRLQQQQREQRKKGKEMQPLIDEWYYKDNASGAVQGPFTTNQMIAWSQAGYFPGNTPLTNGNSAVFKPISNFNLHNCWEKIQENMQQEADSLGIQERIAALKKIKAEDNNVYDDENDGGVQDRIAALKGKSATKDTESSKIRTQENTADMESDSHPTPYHTLDDQGIQDRVATLKQIKVENSNNCEDDDGGVQDRIAVLKGEMESKQSKSEMESPYPPNDDDFSPYPPIESNTYEPASYPIMETEATPYPSLGEEDNAENQYSKAYDHADLAYGAYPTATEDGLEMYPGVDDVVAPYPGLDEIKGDQSVVKNETIAKPLKKFAGDRALVGFVPSHVRKNKKRIHEKSKPLTVKRPKENPSVSKKQEKSTSVLKEYESFMNDVAKL